MPYCIQDGVLFRSILGNISGTISLLSGPIYAKSTFPEPKCPPSLFCISALKLSFPNQFFLPSCKEPFSFPVLVMRWMDLVAFEDAGEERAALSYSYFHSFLKDILALLYFLFLPLFACGWVNITCISVFQNTSVQKQILSTLLFPVSSAFIWWYMSWIVSNFQRLGTVRQDQLFPFIPLVFFGNPEAPLRIPLGSEAWIENHCPKSLKPAFCLTHLHSDVPILGQIPVCKA